MNNWKNWINNIKSRPYSSLGLLILLAIPVTIFLVFQSQDTRSSAAEPDKIEAEDGVPSATGVEVKSDTNASGGKYVEFSGQTNNCTQDVKTCSDGSSVGRDPSSNCEFYACPAPTVKAFEQSNINITMEGENFMDRKQNGSTYDWKIITSGTYPESPSITLKYISATPNDNKTTYFKQNIANSPETVYNLKFSEPGRFYVWLRSGGPDAKSDSAHVGLNGKLIGPMALYYKGEGGKSADWLWENKYNDSSFGTRVFIDVTPEMVEKVQTFHVWMRESGTRIDRINITKDSTWTGGSNGGNRGPAQSAINSFPSN